GAIGGQREQTTAVQLLKRNVDSLTAEISSRDPAATPALSNRPLGGPAAVALLPPNTSEDVITLVVQRDALLASIQGSRPHLADDYISSILPSSFASTLQNHTA